MKIDHSLSYVAKRGRAAIERQRLQRSAVSYFWISGWLRLFFKCLQHVSSSANELDDLQSD
jgi:hypothetical protein